MADEYGDRLGSSENTGGRKSAGGLKGGLQAVGRGLAESVPFTGEALAEGLDLPKPSTFTERLTRRAARNAPYALAAAPFGGVPAALGYVGSVGLGQAAEEFGVPESYQPVAEVLGGGAGQVAAGTAGRAIGYIEPKLNDMYKQAKNTFKLGPGAKTAEGMKYGAGDTAVEASQNLTRATELATERTGFKTSSVDGPWIENTGNALGNEVQQLFGGKTFTATPGGSQKFLNDITALEQDANSAFGDQGNVVKTILDKNIQGQRVNGKLVDAKFDAMGLRGAIEEVNQELATAEGRRAKILHKTAEALHDLAEKNLEQVSTKLVDQYRNWRKAYTSFATIREVYSKVPGRTAAGQIPLDELHQAIIKRGSETTHPLYAKLAEWGPLFRGAKQTSKPGAIPAAYRTITESPLAKLFQSAIQPSVPKQFTGFPGKYAQKVAPYVQTTAPIIPQAKLGKDKAEDTYGGRLGN
jgi:hypothetical protein